MAACVLRWARCRHCSARRGSSHEQAMTIVERRVRTLRVRAPDEGRARHAAIVIEDALRTATMPGASGARVIVIRRLDIGAVSATASPTTVSLAIENSLHRLAADAIHGESPSAADASVV